MFKDTCLCQVACGQMLMNGLNMLLRIVALVILACLFLAVTRRRSVSCQVSCLFWVAGFVLHSAWLVMKAGSHIFQSVEK